MPNQYLNPVLNPPSAKLLDPVPIEDYTAAAFDLYKKLYSRRCTGCHDYVDIPKDGILYQIPDTGDYVLVHRACVDK